MSNNPTYHRDPFGGTQIKWIATKQLLDKSINILEIRKINDSEYVCLSNRTFRKFDHRHAIREFSDRVIKQIPYTSDQDIDNLKELMNNHVFDNP